MPEISKSNSNQNKEEVQEFVLNIRSRTSKLFEGKVKSVTSINQTGEFDVLALHANFISIISKYILINKGMDDAKKIDIKSAVMSVIDGKMDVYVEI